MPISSMPPQMFPMSIASEHLMPIYPLHPRSMSANSQDFSALEQFDHISMTKSMTSPCDSLTVLLSDETDETPIEPWHTVFVPEPAEKETQSTPEELVQKSKKRKHKPRICEIENCTNGVRSRGRCKAHGGGRRCQVPECKMSDQGGGKCIAHGGGRRCSFQNCSNSAQSKGLCKSHGGGRRCSFKSCEKSSQGGGFCRSHGGGKRCTHTDAYGVICNKGTQRAGLCAAHYRAKAALEAKNRSNCITN